MDPLTSLVTALAAGAAAALQSTVEQTVKDGYAALKGIIQRKYAQVNVNQLEANPSSQNRRGVVEEELAAAGADQDAEVLRQAQVLLEALQRQAPEAARAIGVDIEAIKAAALTISDVRAHGPSTAVHARNLDVAGKVHIEGVQADSLGGPPPNP